MSAVNRGRIIKGAPIWIELLNWTEKNVIGLKDWITYDSLKCRVGKIKHLKCYKWHQSVFFLMLPEIKSTGKESWKQRKSLCYYNTCSTDSWANVKKKSSCNCSLQATSQCFVSGGVTEAEESGVLHLIKSNCSSRPFSFSNVTDKKNSQNHTHNTIHFIWFISISKKVTDISVIFLFFSPTVWELQVFMLHQFTVECKHAGHSVRMMCA